MSKLKVGVNGKTYDIEIENAFVTPMTVIVNGNSYQVDIEQETGGIPKIEHVQESVVHVSVPAKVSVPAPATRAPVESSAGQICAPMPGVIVEVYVKTGQKVASGEQICALEAMKMKNIIRANRDGVVGSVDVREGQKVAYNDVLVTFQ